MWRHSESLSIRMVNRLTRCGFGRYVSLCNISFLSIIDRFSSIAFLVTNYRTYNLIMEWSYEDVVRWAILNLKVDQSIIARLRGQCWSIRRLVCCIETDVAYEAYVYLHHSALLPGTASVPQEQDLHRSNHFLKSLSQEDHRESDEQSEIEWIIHGFTLRRELMPPDRIEYFNSSLEW